MKNNNTQTVPDGWRETTLGSVVDIKYGKDYKSLTDGEYPLYGSGGVMKYVSDFLYDKPSVLIPRKGTLTNLFYIEEPFWTVDTLFYTKIDENKNLPKFLFYKLKTLKLSDMNVGSAVPSLTTDVLNKIVFNLPLLPEQKVIAGVLSSLDDKIELLREQNKTLETMAQALFKHWFVDFEFPNKDGKPYKSLGGKMVDSELGEIPDGWKVGKISDFGEIVCGKTPLTAHIEYYGGKVPFIKIPDMHNQMFVVDTGATLSDAGAETQSRKTLPPYSICVSCIATVGLVSLTSKASQTNQQINSIIPNDGMYTEYLFLKLRNMYKFLNDLGGGGSATLNMNTGIFSDIEMLFPVEHTLSAFSGIIKNHFERILKNNEQIQTLTKTRDALLPKLMRGDVRVKM